MIELLEAKSDSQPDATIIPACQVGFLQIRF